MSDGERLLRIEAPHFTAGVIIRDGTVYLAPPILKYTTGWPAARLLRYAERHAWTATPLDNHQEGRTVCESS